MGGSEKATRKTSASETAAKVYTRTGDKGKTSLVGGTRVSKADPRLEAYGTVDELNSVIGVLMSEIARSGAAGAEACLTPLTSIQRELFNVGSRLACEDGELLKSLPRVEEERIPELERWMDGYSEKLAPLKNFILPGGSPAAAQAHVARTVCRRAERVCQALSESVAAADGDHSAGLVEDVVIRYLNRLSDFLFVLARHLNRLAGISEPIWKPNAT